MNGNISDQMLNLAMSTLDRLEADGISIVVDVALKTLVLEIVRKTVGRKQVFRVGPLRVTL